MNALLVLTICQLFTQRNEKRHQHVHGHDSGDGVDINLEKKMSVINISSMHPRERSLNNTKLNIL